ncbi:putative pre-mRNA-splicing factor ATP-dependent RNA helicase PRP1 [Bradysia coprophila]|uniref:putative pre-mRNA-splicing factor ATP-dependent RNA helicase PRP1 n=1 Tax=Bradysia coprophila TaxID=38358 RepID=UPI00187D82E0|nr:putative pre-mRNA-splicing factor ATP-dependent RNA helicase PRP1 [Bradysia coprophila]
MDGSMESFKDVGCIIVDEAHLRRRSHVTYCSARSGSPIPRWKDTLVIITSATIDLTLFAQFFYNAPTVQIEGRTFPVDIIYQPAADESNIQRAVSECALQIHLNCRSAPGDILCFLPGLEDITNAKAIFEKELKKVSARKSDRLDAVVFMLYGKQDPDKQAEVFEKLDVAKERKIIFATDIGRNVHHDRWRCINAISKSSAIQRSGRCGRTQRGVCYRLYSQDEFESMNINAAPEVLCRPISLAVLTLLELSLDPQKFDWISPPSTEAIVNAEKELIILGAVDLQRKPTELGKFDRKVPTGSENNENCVRWLREGTG